MSLIYGILLTFFGYFSYFYFKLVHIGFSFCNLLFNDAFVPKPNDEDTDQLLLISASQAAEMIRSREIRSQQLVEVYIRRIKYIDNMLNTVVQQNFDDAIKRAKSVDEFLSYIDPHSEEYKQLEKTKPLLGVPFTCKDSVRVKGLRTVCGIPALVNAPLNEEDADAVKLLSDAGAIHLATTNVPEAGLWWETSNKIYGRTRNPYDMRLSAGGSSGGEAALIAAAGSLIGIGSDFGGSIRIPCLFNGVFGLKPSPKLISFKGHLPEKLPSYHQEMVTLGPICRYAKDLSVMLKIMVGPRNSTFLKLDERVNLRSVKVYYMRGLNNLLCSPVQQECTEALQKVTKYFSKKYDNAVYNVDFPIGHNAVDIFLRSMKCPDALPVKNCLNGFTEDKGINVLLESLKFLLGQSNHSAAALQAAIGDSIPNIFANNEDFVISKRNQLKREITDLLGQNGILIFPFPRSYYYHNEPLMFPFDFIYAGLWNALGMPCLSCPIGLSSSNIPVGVQVVAAPNADRLLLAVSCDLEEAFGGWHPRELN